jgi:hypothetical protein
MPLPFPLATGFLANFGADSRRRSPFGRRASPPFKAQPVYPLLHGCENCSPTFLTQPADSAVDRPRQALSVAGWKRLLPLPG